MAIVGIVGDVRQMGLDVEGRAEMYLPGTQPLGLRGFFTPRDLAVRLQGQPERYGNALRAAVWAVDKNQPVSDMQTLQEMVDRELST